MGWTTLLVDAHVHAYPGFDRALLLDAAAAHFARAAGELRGVIGCLMLTETPGEDAFSGFARDELPPWSFRPTGEGRALLALRDGRPGLILVAGRQIVTRERLEVLALGCEPALDDGKPLQGTLTSVVAADALPVLPWGLGKWWLGRGRAVLELLGSERAGQIFLGDNRGRPRGVPEARALRMARERGVPILPGSDPLPFPGTERHVGSFGCVLEGVFDEGTPAAQILDALRMRRQPPCFGRRASAAGVVLEQLRLRRARRRAAAGNGA